MTPKPTPLANWITHYTDNRGGDVIRALHDLATDIGLHDHEDSADRSKPSVASSAQNPARDRVSTSRAHRREKARSDSTASDSESGGEVRDA